jgi:hypothetical protein
MKRRPELTGPENAKQAKPQFLYGDAAVDLHAMIA